MESENKIILIEDDKKKIDDIKDFLYKTYKYQNLVVKESYQSGLRELIFNKYDLLLLDMSIPTWDKISSDPSGNYQKFGGYLILKEITRKKKPVKTILISMFDDFGESDRSVTLSQLAEGLKKEFSEIFMGSIFYSSRQTKWKDELKLHIQKAIE